MKTTTLACIEKGMTSIDKVLVSPYRRAQQTWQTMQPYLKAEQVETCDDITPYGQAESVAEFIQALVEVEPIDTLLLVSHLPLVSYLTAELVRGIAPPMFPTAGMVAIDYDPKTQQGELLWQCTPNETR